MLRVFKVVVVVVVVVVVNDASVQIFPPTFVCFHLSRSLKTFVNQALVGT